MIENTDTRQQKIAKQIQRDIAEILQKEGKAIVGGSLVTVTTVRVSPDFAYAKVYFSIFPFSYFWDPHTRKGASFWWH